MPGDRLFRSNNSPMSHNITGVPMTGNQSNKHSMYTATVKLLRNGAAKTAVIPAFAGALQRMDTLVMQIGDKDKERMGKTTGKHAVKDEAEDALMTATIILASALSAFARSQGNTELKERVHIRENQLRHARSNEQINVAKIIHDLAKANEQGLVEFGVNAAMMEDLKSRIAAYEAAVKDWSSGVAERVGARTAVGELFVQADEILKEDLDPMMQIFRVTDPEFYNDYRAARVIKDIGVRHNKTGQPAAPAPGSPN
jgi:hypothetical protein